VPLVKPEVSFLGWKSRRDRGPSRAESEPGRRGVASWVEDSTSGKRRLLHNVTPARPPHRRGRHLPSSRLVGEDNVMTGSGLTRDQVYGRGTARLCPIWTRHRGSHIRGRRPTVRVLGMKEDRQALTVSRLPARRRAWLRSWTGTRVCVEGAEVSSRARSALPSKGSSEGLMISKSVDADWRMGRPARAKKRNAEKSNGGLGTVCLRPLARELLGPRRHPYHRARHGSSGRLTLSLWFRDPGERTLRPISMRECLTVTHRTEVTVRRLPPG